MHCHLKENAFEKDLKWLYSDVANEKVWGKILRADWLGWVAMA